MDLDQDGKLDILSGSYSRKGSAMAGTFQVLYGTGARAFRTAVTMTGSDGNPLIIEHDKKQITDAICTRPTAVDLDADGKLDIVAGNFTGTFALFRGLGVQDGKISIAPATSWLRDTGGKKLRVRAHSDPFFCDWDADGDLDMLSGSNAGGVQLFTNVGTKNEPSFDSGRTLVAATTAHQITDDVKIGEDHIRGPQHATRVWADDLDGDGKLDLLVGDQLTIYSPAEGVDEATMRKRLAAWTEKSTAINAAWRKVGDDRAAQRRISNELSAHYKARGEFLVEDRTGFVWVYYQR